MTATKSLLRLFLRLLVLFIPLVHSRELCHNNGTLAIEGKVRTCNCPHPFTGQFCEDYACVNGISTGSQYDADSIFFNRRCLCDPGWTGELCTESLINQCGENGYEVNGKCECRNNFVGERCQHVTKCIQGQLYNGRCACYYGWAGDFCDKIICHHGMADESNTKCICPSKYRGQYCDFCAESSRSPPPECPEIRPRICQIDVDRICITVAVVITIAFVLLGIACCSAYYKLWNVKQAAKTTRQTTADIIKQMPTTTYEICPLNGGGQTQITEIKLIEESENFYDFAPPSYDKLVDVQKQQNALIKEETEETTEEANLSLAGEMFSLEALEMGASKFKKRTEKLI